MNNIIKNLKKLKSFHNGSYGADIDRAIKALEQEPCKDAIDRAEAMTEIMMFAGNVKSDEEDIYIKVSDAVQLLRALPSVTPTQEPILDKISEEIEGLDADYDFEGFYKCQAKVLGIIYKYKTESEEEYGGI